MGDYGWTPEAWQNPVTPGSPAGEQRRGPGSRLAVIWRAAASVA
jgi:hypothetical protein